ncbi:MAG: TlyA family RNA methyltransferase [Thermodesulfobacteriota bacterium]
MEKKRKVRLDKLVLERALVKSRQKAQALIMAGQILVDGRVVDKAGTAVDPESELSVKEALPYVSRGGVKLQGALDKFKIDAAGLTALDVGASTGGFTDCLLKRGAAKVIAVDVGKGLIDWGLRGDKRVKLLEGRNIRYLEPDEVGEKVGMAVIDVSFISLEKVIPRVKEFLKPGAVLLALVKPQFEVGKGEVGKGGIVKDPEKHRSVVERIRKFSVGEGFTPLGECDSPIKGAKGNKEFWLHLSFSAA